MSMLRNYLVIALRTLRRQKLYSSLNVLSLSVGIACCALILLFVRHEWQADAFHENVDDVYRVYRVEHRVNGDTKLSSGVSTPLGPALLRDLPGVERAVRMRRGQVQVERGREVFTEGVLFAEAGFFEMFSFPFTAAGSSNPLATPGSVVLSAEMAQKYFGDADPTGESLRIQLTERVEEFVVAGVASPLPNTSSITFDLVVPYTQWPGYAARADTWESFNTAVYVQAKPGVDQATLQGQLDPLVNQYYGDMIAQAQANDWWVRGDNAFALRIQPLREVHFSQGFTNMIATTSNPGNLYIMMGIALLVLLLAGVNFMTLAAGRASSRAREVGVRKALGAERTQLARQFFGEALLLSTVSLGLGLVLATVLLPMFNDLAESSIGLQNVDLMFALGLVALTLVCGLAAGSYPAVVLSGFRPTQVLKGEVSARTGLTFTRGLVVFQFAISIGMLSATLAIFSQLDYVQTKNLGFADDEILAIDLQSSQTDEEAVLARLRNGLQNRADIVSVAASSYAFADGWSRTVMRQEGHEIIVYMTRVDPLFLETMGTELVAGRNFSADLETDREQSVVINQALANELSWDNPVGQLLPGYEDDNVTIIGVVADYHFQSLRDEIGPMFLHMSPSIGTVDLALVRLHTTTLNATLSAVESAWEAAAPDEPFIYQFMDEQFDALYAEERRWGRIVQSAAFLALLIAAMGLFGLATLSFQRRRKEVGLRKVLGASASGVALLLSRDFAVLVVVAFCFAAPASYAIMNRWLDGFAFHADLGPGIFIASGGLALFIALATISSQALKAGLSDPVRSLRHE